MSSVPSGQPGGGQPSSAIERVCAHGVSVPATCNAELVRDPDASGSVCIVGEAGRYPASQVWSLGCHPIEQKSIHAGRGSVPRPSIALVARPRGHRPRLMASAAWIILERSASAAQSTAARTPASLHRARTEESSPIDFEAARAALSSSRSISSANVRCAARSLHNECAIHCWVCVALELIGTCLELRDLVSYRCSVRRDIANER
jgi:hypothetical protein